MSIKTVFAALTICALFCAPASAKPLEPLPATEWVFQAANLADMGLTLDIKNHPGLQEVNPFLGHHPSDGAIVGFKLGIGILHAVVSEAMIQQGVSKRTIRLWEYVSIGGTLAAVGNNASLGLRFRF